MTPKVIFEVSDILVLDKPAGMIVNRSGIVHRLDRMDMIKLHFRYCEYNDHPCQNRY